MTCDSQGRQASIDERGVAFVDASGRWLAKMPADMFGGEGIVAEIEILRGDLTRILYETSRHDTEYLFDDSITGLIQDDEGVTVTFERGAVRTFDLVVGADGVRSRVRSLAFGDESAFLRPLGAYTSYFTVPNKLEVDGWFLLYNAPVAKRRPSAPTVKIAPRPCSASLRRRCTTTVETSSKQKKILAEAFAGIGWQVPRLLEAMWDTRPTFTSTCSARSVWTAGQTGEWRWSVTPGTAHRR